MPELSRFYGVSIRMYSRDHNPPHFHAIYAEHKALVEIATGAILAGSLPARAQRLLEEWTRLHRAELSENWECAQTGRPCFGIEPL